MKKKIIKCLIIFSFLLLVILVYFHRTPEVSIQYYRLFLSEPYEMTRSDEIIFEKYDYSGYKNDSTKIGKIYSVKSASKLERYLVKKIFIYYTTETYYGN